VSVDPFRLVYALGNETARAGGTCPLPAFRSDATLPCVGTNVNVCLPHFLHALLQGGLGGLVDMSSIHQGAGNSIVSSGNGAMLRCRSPRDQIVGLVRISGIRLLRQGVG
jgi:hypothetical protein